MKILAALLGALAAGIISFIVFALISSYQVSQLNYTPSQSDDLTDLFIIVTILAIVFGSWASVRIYNKKHLTKQINSDS